MPMGGRLGWGEGACSAGGAGVEADARAASECSVQELLSPGLGLELHAGQQAHPGNPWKRVALAAHFERSAAGHGADAGLPPG